MADDVPSRQPLPRRSRGTDAPRPCAPGTRALAVHPDHPTAAPAGSPGT